MTTMPLSGHNAPEHEVTALPTGPTSALAALGVISALEIVTGRAVVVICEHHSGTVGIGSFVHGRSRTTDEARRLALEHALRRLTLLKRQFAFERARLDDRRQRLGHAPFVPPSAEAAA